MITTIFCAFSLKNFLNLVLEKFVDGGRNRGSDSILN